MWIQNAECVYFVKCLNVKTSELMHNLAQNQISPNQRRKVYYLCNVQHMLSSVLNIHDVLKQHDFQKLDSCPLFLIHVYLLKYGRLRLLEGLQV